MCEVEESSSVPPNTLDVVIFARKRTIHTLHTTDICISPGRKKLLLTPLSITFGIEGIPGWLSTVELPSRSLMHDTCCEASRIPRPSCKGAAPDRSHR